MQFLIVRLLHLAKVELFRRTFKEVNSMTGLIAVLSSQITVPPVFTLPGQLSRKTPEAGNYVSPRVWHSLLGSTPFITAF